ncbi:hypothetical protein BS333_07105 [Vibrio azureus]|uniref:Uncharacterized protein n=1 Tax=Vibrio azureus NBRC 104587 TaxID=1219077 RepID=U3ASJ1_9VIBR|nr:hypothetical protein [Vibrio azureus]AUI86174.1 hypothetical protein BS333_07105 [Vibrio azureus]GAD76720.1 hypothetical protein VAZ01S_050_00320 [Vibrio azureus NBRC 104587]
MVTVDKQDSTTLKISHALAKSKTLDLDIYIFVPGELGLNSDIISESEFYYTSITQKRSYYSTEILLPLVHSRLAKRGHLSNRQYRVSLSLFAYQYVTALDKAVEALNKHESDTVTEDDVDEVIELTIDILKRLRRSIPYEESLKRYYVNIDNYLSWYTEQKFLSLVAHLPREGDYSTIKERLITLCEKEQAHRKLNNYNSAGMFEDVTRLSNKMRLLRRLIEHPIVLREKTTSMGKNIKRATKGIATGLVMVVVTTTVIMARDYLGEISASFIIAMSFIYALREIFKDDLRDAMWRWIRKGKPKWRKKYMDPTTKKFVGRKLEWLDYRSLSSLPDRIQSIRKKRVVQREEQILHYHAKTEMATTSFLSGYEQTRETLNISLRPIIRLMDKSTNRVYKLNDGQVSKESVEKRHLLNVIVKECNHTDEPIYYRWKVVLNRSKIVSIEKIELT